MRSKSSAKRIEFLDILRGYFLLVILVDHLELFPNIFELVTGRGLLWVSAAQGFFFVSGILVAVVYYHRSSKEILYKKLLKRAKLLYFITVLFSVTLTYITRFWYETTGEVVKDGALANESFVEVLWRSATLQYVYGWTDFLAYYAVYLVAAIGLLYMLKISKPWLLLTTAIAPWSIAWLFGWRTMSTLWLVWFCFFGLGVYVGFYREKVAEYALRCSEDTTQSLAKIKYLLSFYTQCCTKRHNNLIPFGIGADARDAIEPFLFSNRTGILILPVFALWMSVGAYLAWKYASYLPKPIYSVLHTYGKQSLRTYIVQGLVLYFLADFFTDGESYLLNSIITFAFIMAVYGLHRLPITQRVIPK